jgi:hypothetical protein
MNIKTLSVVLQCGSLAATLMFGVSSDAAAAGVWHTVHAGGPDVCDALGKKPGCDANLSLTAILYDDGSATGQLTDRYSIENGGGGVQGQINCVAVEHDPGSGWTVSWVSGVVTGGNAEDLGKPFLMGLIDTNGRGIDAFDIVSFPLIGIDQPCSEENMFVWSYALPTWRGQVTIK